MKPTVSRSKKGVQGRLLRGPFFVLVCGMFATIAGSTFFYFAATRSDKIRFTTEETRVSYAVKAHLDVYDSLLMATRGFVETSSDLNSRKFKNFVGQLGVHKTYNGIQGIGYTKVVRPGELGPLMQRLRAEGIEGFAPYPEANRSIEQTIIYLEPQDDRNKRAIGFDMSSEANRKLALDRARDTSEIAATSKVTLVQEITSDKQSGFLFYLPVYKSGRIPSTLEERRAKIDGFVYAPFRAGDFFQEVRQTIGSDQVLISVYDGSEDSRSLLYEEVQTSALAFGLPLIEVVPMAREEVEVHGRKWVIRYFANEAFMSRSNVWGAPIILVLGTFVSGALFAVVSRESRTRIEAEATAFDLVRSEKENQRLFEKESAARRQAEEAGRVKDEFISVVSHELRTPLNAIAGWTRVLKANDLTQATKDSALEKIEKNLRLQASLIEDIITFSQMASGGFTLQRDRFDLLSVIGSVLTELEPFILEKKLLTKVHDEGGGVLMRGDSEKLRMVALKLVSNALKFTSNHGEIDVTVKREGDWMLLKVKDTGRGISSDFLPFIFDRFTQQDASTTRRFGGLGLGLAICRKIVELHDGSIEVHSAGEGRGAEVIVRLPIEPPESEGVKERP